MAQRYNTPDAAGVLHYVTLNVRDKRTAFSRGQFAGLCLDELRKSCDLHPANLAAYIVMPDHLHFIVFVANGELTNFISSFKPAVTRAFSALAKKNCDEKVIRWLSQSGRPELWQEGKHSQHLWSGYMIRQKIQYVHNNPVRSGLVQKQSDYRWSSAGAYFPEWGVEPPVTVDLVWK